MTMTTPRPDQTEATGFYKEIAFDQIVVVGNIRKDLGDVDDLAQSIYANGLLNPLVVFPINDTYGIIAGHRRHAAITKLIAEDRWFGPVPCIWREIDPDTFVAAQLVENLQRNDINVVDEALAIQQLVIEHSWSAADVAINIGRSEKLVKERLQLCQCIPAILDRLRKGDMTLEAALLCAKAPTAVQEKISVASGYNLHATTVASTIAEARRNQAKKGLLAALKEAGVTKHESRYPYNGQVIATLKKATTKNIGPWVLENDLVAKDATVHFIAGWQSDSTTFELQAAVPRQARTHDSGTPQPWVAPAATDLYDGEELPQELLDWYQACAEVAEAIANHSREREALIIKARMNFVHDASKADITAAAVTNAADDAVWQMVNRFRQGIAGTEAVCTAMGWKVEDFPTEPKAEDIREKIFADAKSILRAAAYSLSSSTSAPLYQTFLSQLPEELDAPTFPVAPAVVNDRIKAITGMTFEELQGGDIEFYEIEQLVESWGDMEDTYGPDEDEPEPGINPADAEHEGEDPEDDDAPGPFGDD